MRYQAQIEMHTQTVDELNVRILGLLRDALVTAYDWDELDEGTWQEYARPGGCNYVPGLDRWEDEEGYLDTVELTEMQVAFWEDRLMAQGGEAYGDGDTGMYYVNLE